MNRKGQTTVETALMIFLLFILMVGIFDFGRAMYVKNTLNNAARSAAREAAVTGTINAAIVYNAGQLSTKNGTDKIQQKIHDGLIIFNQDDKDHSTATVRVYNSSNTETYPAVAGYTVVVNVTSPYKMVISKLTPKISPTLTGTASMRYE